MAKTTTHFHVSRMKCSGCVSTATAALNTVVGVESVVFDLANGTATVVGEVDPQAVCQALTEAGYPAVVKSGGHSVMP